jgi:hypothetical protein
MIRYMTSLLAQPFSPGLKSWWKHLLAGGDGRCLIRTSSTSLSVGGPQGRLHISSFFRPFTVPRFVCRENRKFKQFHQITMGFDCGFDIYPRLETTASNKETYRRFLDEIIRTYENVYDKEGRMTDGKVLDIPINSHHSDKIYIWFMVGESPHIPGNPNRCDYFLRFSSKVSGRLKTPAEPYIRSVYKIAKKYFGSRVHFWHEMDETGDERQWGYYDWQEVHDADRKLRELETGQEQDLQNRALGERVGETNDEPNLSSVTLPTRANLTRSACDVDLHLRSQPGVTRSRCTSARSPTSPPSSAPMMSPTVSRAENVDLSDLMKSISLGNEIKDGPEGKSHVSGSPNPVPNMSVNISNHGRAPKIQFDETSASPAEVAVMQQIMAVAFSPQTRSVGWEGNLLGLVAFDALHAAL